MELAVWNRTPGRAEAAVSGGAHGAHTPAEAEGRRSVMSSMLFDDAAHEEVLLGEDGAVRRAFAGHAAHLLLHDRRGTERTAYQRT